MTKVFQRTFTGITRTAVRTALPALLLCSAFGISPAQAADLSAHEHGVAHLTLAQEGREISISFTAAADSVLGFEHAPGNAKERAALQQAAELFQQPDNWLQLPVACRLTARQLDLPFINAAAHHADDTPHNDGDHSADDHNEEHHHDEPDEHTSAHTRAEHHQGEQQGHGNRQHTDRHHQNTDGAAAVNDKYSGGHADVHVRYSLQCEAEQATPVRLNLFSQLPYLQQLRIEAVSERAVVVTELEGDVPLEW